MPDITILAIFIPTFFFISITPGMCMSLALTLGMTFGLRRTLWMMLGEIFGVALVAVLSVLGVASLVMQYPTGFIIFKYLGGIYLIYLGIKMFFKPVHLDVNTASLDNSRKNLLSMGFITAIANPKGWAFMIALLPPFIDLDKPLPLQLIVLVSIIMLSELICMLIYASGGRGLKKMIAQNENLEWVNRIGGSLLVLVGIWLAIG